MEANMIKMPERLMDATAGLKPHKRGRGSVVTVNYTDLIYTLRPCRKCVYCGHSVTT